MASKFAGSFYVSVWPHFIEWTFQQIIPFDIDTCSVVDAINAFRPSDAYKRQYTNRHSFRNGLSHGRGHAIIWTNIELWSIGPLRIYFS